MSTPVSLDELDRGLLWAYAFNHEETVRCFEHAIAHHERFALARAGVPIHASRFCRLERA